MPYQKSKPVPPPTLDRPTSFGADERIEVAGLKADIWADAYTLLLGAKWRYIILGYVLVAVLTNIVFGFVFLFFGGVANAHPGSFKDAFVFSVQTLSTLGYGPMYPASDASNAVVGIEWVVGLLEATLVTGLVFAKFSRPVARIMFSKYAVVSSVDGIPTLQFRTGNARGNHIVDAEATLVLIRWEQTAEGRSLYRMHDLKLVRSRSPAFKNTWMVLHHVTEHSPLFGLDAASAAALDIELATTVTGIDGTTSQTVHASHSYVADDLRFGERFVDMVSDLPGGRLHINYAKFDETEKARELQMRDQP
jgi:inward rectifier potassium channel